jgi:hypothetical protein
VNLYIAGIALVLAGVALVIFLFFGRPRSR